VLAPLPRCPARAGSSRVLPSRFVTYAGGLIHPAQELISTAVNGLERYGLRESELDDMIVFWHRGDVRLALLPLDYSEAKEYLERLIDRLDLVSHRQSLGSQLTRLREPGRVVPLVQRQYTLGLMRPWLLHDREFIDTSEKPVLLCAEPPAGKGTPLLPILAGDEVDAAALVRRLREEEEIDEQLWHGYECERQVVKLQRLILQMRGDQVSTSKTAIEADIVAARLMPQDIVASRLRQARPEAPPPLPHEV
jgi:hypothetical protein